MNRGRSRRKEPAEFDRSTVSVQISDQSSSASAGTPLAYQVVRGGFWVAVSSYWTIAFGFAATLWITRLLDAEAFGVFALATFFAQLFRLQTKLGLGHAYAQRQNATEEELSTYVIMDTLAALGGLLVTFIGALILPSFGYSGTVVQITVILALGAMLETLTGIGAMLLEKELHFRQTSIVQSIVFPISYAPAIWLATNGGGVWSLVAQNLIYNGLYLIGIWWVVGRRMPRIWRIRWRFDLVIARQFLRFGSTAGLGLMAATMLVQLDNFLIGTFVGVTVLGFYDRAYRTAQWPSTLFFATIARTSFYTFSKLQDDVVRLGKTVTMLLWLITALAVPLALIVFITAPDLVSLLYGESWLPSALFLRFLIVYAVIRPVWDSVGALFVAIGKPKLMTRYCVVQVLVLTAAGLPMTMLWGAVGTCLAVALAFAVGGVLAYSSLNREIPIELSKELGLPLLVSILVLIGYAALNRVTPINDLNLAVRVAVKGVYALGMFFGITFLLQPTTTRERLGYIWNLARQARKRN